MPISIPSVTKHILPISDGFTMGDTLVSKLSLAIVDGFDLTDTLVTKLSITIADGFDIADTLVSKLSITIADGFDLNDVNTMKISIVISDGFDLTDVVVIPTYLVLSDGFALADATSFKAVVKITDGFDLTDSTSLGIDWTLSPSDGFALTDAIACKWGFAISDGFTIASDTFPILHKDSSDMVTDFAAVMADSLAENVTLRRQTTTTDTLGNLATIPATDVTVAAYFTSTSLKDRNMAAPGISITGLLTGYFEPVYTVSSVDYTVKQGDIIIRNSIQWRVMSIERTYRLGNRDIYIKAIMRRE